MSSVERRSPRVGRLGRCERRFGGGASAALSEVGEFRALLRDQTRRHARTRAAAGQLSAAPRAQSRANPNGCSGARRQATSVSHGLLARTQQQLRAQRRA